MMSNRAYGVSEIVSILPCSSNSNALVFNTMLLQYFVALAIIKSLNLKLGGVTARNAYLCVAESVPQIYEALYKGESISERRPRKQVQISVINGEHVLSPIEPRSLNDGWRASLARKQHK